ncbi:MAG: ubiquitin-like small modifier protein 1 [Myxococcaceae bacterium]
MSVTVELPAYLRSYADGVARVELSMNGATVKEVLDALFTRHPGLRDRVLDEREQVRLHVNIFVGAESIRFTGGLETKVPDGERVTVLPAVSGG